MSPTPSQSFKIHPDINCLSTDNGVFCTRHLFARHTNAIGCTFTLCLPLFRGMVRDAVRMDRLALCALTRTAPRSPAGPGSIAAECHLLGAAEHHQKTAPCIFSYWKVIFMRVNNSCSSLCAFCSFTQHPSSSPPWLIDAICKTGWEKKLNPKSEPDAQVTANQLASLLNSDMRPECFVVTHANLLSAFPCKEIQILALSCPPAGHFFF